MTIESHQAPIQREAMHRIPNEWDREQADTAPYPADDMSAVTAIGWVLLWALTIAVACGGSAWLGMVILQWLEPHWPALVSMVTP